MNNLIQLESSLIGSEEAVARLAQEDKRCFLVASDTHGQAEVLKEIILAYGKESDALIFCGDGGRDLLSVCVDSQKNSKLAAALPPVIAAVQGNGDGQWYSNLDAYTGIEDTPVTFRFRLAQRLVFEAADRTVFVTHGQQYGVDIGTDRLVSAASIMDADMVFFGHTHCPFVSEAKNPLILNPGSCTQPRGAFPPSFVLVSFPGTTEYYNIQFYAIQKSAFGSAAFVPIPLHKF